MDLKEVLEGVFITRFAHFSKLKTSKIYYTDRKYLELPYNYRLGIKLCIKSLYLSYNEILAYREDKKDVSRIDINHYLSILRKSPIEIKYLVGYLGSNDKYHYSSKFVSVGNVDQCADEILHSIVCILNRFLDYANED